MKRLLILYLSVIINYLAVGQSTEYCGTEMPEAMLDWLKQYKQSTGPVAHKQADDAIFYIPLKIHVVGNDNGGGYYKTELLLEAMCNLNVQFEPVGFHFYLFDDVNYINNSALFDHSGFSVGSIVHQTNVANAANLYFVQNPAGACGYFSGWADFVALSKSCSGVDNATIAHELGHYFSLPHTFRGWENRTQNDAARWNDERVNGTNCATAGDYFCDTPADYLSDRWNCPFARVKTDYNGDQYEVDGSFFMSYANDVCQDKFSVEQIDAMKSYLQSNRPYLLNHPDPLIQDVEETATIYPPNNSDGIPANYVNLKWKASKGATHYSLLATRYPNGNFFNVDIIVEDTSILLTDLEVGKNYKWKVRPFNAANTCTGYTEYANFNTVEATPIVPSFAVKSESCAGMKDGSILVEATGGSAPYTYSWAHGESSTNLSNLDAGNYELTISDINNDSLVLSLDIIGHREVQAEFVQQNYKLSVNAEGGVPPYTYFWSNNSRNQEINMKEAGEYSVTVTDYLGCATSKVYTFTSVSEKISEVDIRLYPNPVNRAEPFRVEVKSDRVFNGSIRVYDNAGKELLSMEKTFQPGANTEALNLSRYGPGVYVIRIVNENAAFSKKVVVF